MLPAADLQLGPDPVHPRGAPECALPDAATAPPRLHPANQLQRLLEQGPSDGRCPLIASFNPQVTDLENAPGGANSGPDH